MQVNYLQAFCHIYDRIYLFPFSSIQLRQQILTYTQLFTTSASKTSFPEPWLDIRCEEPYFWVSATIDPQYRSDAITQDQVVHRLAFQPST